MNDKLFTYEDPEVKMLIALYGGVVVGRGYFYHPMIQFPSGQQVHVLTPSILECWARHLRDCENSR